MVVFHPSMKVFLACQYNMTSKLWPTFGLRLEQVLSAVCLIGHNTGVCDSLMD